MRLQIIVILLAISGITIGLAQLGEEFVTIKVTSEGKNKISQTLFPKTFVSTIDVQLISEKISNLLAIDEEKILLGTTQNNELLKIATLGASKVDLKYNADILTYESGIFRLKYSSELESRVDLPPLSKLVSLNTIPIEISEEEYILPPGDISLSYSIRPVTSKEFFVSADGSEQKIELITAAKIEELSANPEEIQFIIKDRTIVLTIIPKVVMENPDDALLNGEKADFSQFHQNATHSWIRIDPHEKGLVRILDTGQKEGGGCLIATAAFGSEMAPQVQFLREVRDNQLMSTVLGTAFMTEFNQFYYLFSPTISDWERENPIFKEFVKIVITPLLLSLSFMTFAESENEVLGFGMGVIILNIGMYFVLPIVIGYYVKRVVRTTGKNHSNLFHISRYNVLSVVKTSLFGIIALLVLSVSVSSAVFEDVYADDEEPIKMILEITYQNILESRDDADTIPEASETFFLAGEEKYQEALAALEAGDIVAAKENALVAMALFEDSAEEIGALEDQASTLLPPGLGSGIDSASDAGISEGQGLGVGGIPPGIVQQVTAANIFEIQEQITDLDQEVSEIEQLVVDNKFENSVSFKEYEENINLAKEVLANGDIPNAQAKLALANEMKDDLFEQIDKAIEENQDERVQEFAEESISEIENILAKGENLGLTKKVIDELQGTLDVLKSGEIEEIIEKTSESSEFAKEIEENEDVAKEFDGPGNSENAPGQNNDDSGPGNSENAPGQNNDDSGPGNSENAPGQNNDDSGPGNSENAPGQNNDDSGPGNSENAPGQNNDDNEFDLPPGLGAAEDNPSESGFENGQGVGLGKLPPGLAKQLFEDGGVDDSTEESFEGLPTGIANQLSDAGIDEIDDSFAGLPPGIAKQLLEMGVTEIDDSFAGLPPGQILGSYQDSFGEYSPDDYYDDPIDDLSEDVFEENYDKMNKNSKAKEKMEKAKQAKLDRIADAAANNGPPGLAKKANDGITDGESGNICGIINTSYTVQGFTAIKNGKDFTSNIKIDVGITPTKYDDIEKNESQPFSFTPTTLGAHVITAKVGGLTDVTRTVIIQNSCENPIVENPISDVSFIDPAARTDSVIDLHNVFEDPQDADDQMTYTIESNTFSGTLTSIGIDANDVLTINYDDTIAGLGSGTITVRATDTDANFVEDDFTIAITAAGNNPTVSNTIPNFTINENAPTNTLDLDLVFDDVEDPNALIYTVTTNDNVVLVPTLIVGSTLTLNYADIGSGTANITIRATDTDTNFVETSFTITVNAGECTNTSYVIGSNPSLGGGGNPNTIDDCTVIGDNFTTGNGYDIGRDVRIGDSVTFANNLTIGNGAILGDNVTGGTNETVAAGVIIPDGIAL